MTLRRLVHCALALAVAFAGLAALYLDLGRVRGLAQLLFISRSRHPYSICDSADPYRGAGSDAELEKTFSPAGLAGAVLALAVFAVLAWAVSTGGAARGPAGGAAPQTSMREIGFELMQRYVLPLEVIALTADGGDDWRGDTGDEGEARGFRARNPSCALTPLAGCLLVSALLFSIGLAGALTRRNAILVLAGIELMLNAANLNFIAFWRGLHPEYLTGSCS